MYMMRPIHNICHVSRDLQRLIAQWRPQCQQDALVKSDHAAKFDNLQDLAGYSSIYNRIFILAFLMLHQQSLFFIKD